MAAEAFRHARYYGWDGLFKRVTSEAMGGGGCREIRDCLAV